MSIVVGYLSAAEGVEALDAATAEALRRQTGLVVVVSGRRDLDSAVGLARREADLSVVRGRMLAASLDCRIHEVKDSSDVTEDLVTVAENTKAELIVIGLRRRSPVGKLILGANAQRILLDAPCPVLAVKPSRR